MLRIGLVGCDTSHAVAFTQRLNRVGIDERLWVEGGQVVAAVPGTSLVSPERIPGFVEQLRGWGVAIVERPDELIGRVDAVMLTSADGGVHRELARPFLEAGLPLFVDKPFACSLADARQIVADALAAGVALTSASALRYCPEVRDVQRRAEEVGAIVGVDAYTPGPLHPRNPGLFHYGVHGVEMVYALMGTGCRSVRTVFEEGGEVVVGRWADGRLGTVRATRRGSYALGFTCFGERAVVPAPVDSKRLYSDMLRVAVEMFQTGRWPLTAEELLEPVAFMEAALRSRERGGEEVALGAGD
ncbi:MAG TPA: Gfo/Idh/MocA family oxidoreductase [Chloroflexota bacterium]